MARTCPNCGARIPTFRTLRGKTVRRPGIPWYRYAADRYYCRSCGTELAFKTLPFGHFLTVLWALLVLMTAAIGIPSILGQSRGYLVGRLFGFSPARYAAFLLLVSPIFVFFYKTWGISWHKVVHNKAADS
jgi:hypothetical protein